MNGIHSELNGGGENMALKDEVQHLHYHFSGISLSGSWMCSLEKGLSLHPYVNELMLSSLLR